VGSIEFIKGLLRAGADKNQVESDGWSALHWAARNGYPQVATLILESGAHLYDRNTLEIGGNTPRAWTGNWDVAKNIEHWEVKNLKSRFKYV
jgi:ankyrin repeat protein